MTLQKISLDQFKEVAENAHLLCFDDIRLAGHNTFDYALFVEDDNNSPLAYATCIEMDKKSVYMQHGGAFPPARNGILAVKSYRLVINFLREKYNRASTIIKGNNIAMLKLAFSEGFIPHGADIMPDGFFIHLLNNFSENK